MWEYEEGDLSNVPFWSFNICEYPLLSSDDQFLIKLLGDTSTLILLAQVEQFPILFYYLQVIYLIDYKGIIDTCLNNAQLFKINNIQIQVSKALPKVQ